MKTVYLAGPITGQSWSSATDWRKEITSTLDDRYIKCLSPLRGKEYLEKETILQDNYESSKLSSLASIMSSQRGITTRDRNDVMTCDAILVNLLGATIVSIGTVMEIAWADMLRKPIILVMEPKDNLHDHSMIRECVGFRVTTLEQASGLLNAMFQ